MDLRPGFVPASIRTQISGCGNACETHASSTTCVHRNTTHLEHPADSIEEPAVGVDLLLVLRFDHEDDLYGHEVVRVIRLRNDELRRGVD